MSESVLSTPATIVCNKHAIFRLSPKPPIHDRFQPQGSAESGAAWWCHMFRTDQRVSTETHLVTNRGFWFWKNRVNINELFISVCQFQYLGHLLRNDRMTLIKSFLYETYNPIAKCADAQTTHIQVQTLKKTHLLSPFNAHHNSTRNIVHGFLLTYVASIQRIIYTG